VVNPRREPASVRLPAAHGSRALLAGGVAVDGDLVTVAGFGCGVLA
jgi:hypothetical protein